MGKHIKILLVDDNEVFRQGLRYLLDSEKDMEVVGDCGTAESAFSRLETLSPDIILMDIHMPGIDGVQATWKLKRDGLSYDGDVIVLAESADYLLGALAAGAAGYLLRDSNPEELSQAIRQVYQNGHSAEQSDCFVEQVELVVPLAADAARLQSFARQVETVLQASILQTVGSREQGTAITVSTGRVPLADVAERLCHIPDLEKVEELPSARGFGRFLGRFRVPRRETTVPTARFRATFKETSIAAERFAVASN